MEQPHLIVSESRHAPRVWLPKGLLNANVPPPAVWNWFTDNQLMAVLNLSSVGLGIESEKPVSELVILRLKSNQTCYQVSGRICHQQLTQTGYYYGIDCTEDHEVLEVILKQLGPDKKLFHS